MMLLDTLSNFVMLIMRVQQVPLMSIKSSTMGSTASTIIVHQNWHGACLCLYTISLIQIDLKWFQGDQYALRHPQRPCQPQPFQFQQVPVMFMKIWHITCLYTIIERQINLMWFQGDQEALSDSFRDIIKLNHGEFSKYQLTNFTWHIFISYFSKINQFKMVPGWSRCPGAPSAPSSRSEWVFVNKWGRCTTYEWGCSKKWGQSNTN